MATVNSANFSDGTAGQVLTSNGPATNPTFQAVSAAGAVVTIKGNDAVAEVPDGSGVFNFLTANSTVKFAGSANTETLDFGITNLVLGSALPALAGGTTNVGVGNGALAGITSGSSNTALGYQAGTALSSDSLNVAIGYQALLTKNGVGGLSDIAIGYQALKVYNGLGVNIAIGTQTLVAQTSGIGSTFVGSNSGTKITSGNNTCIGQGSLVNLLTGSGQIVLGAVTGNNYTTNESNNILIGNGVTGVITENNVLRIGQSTGGAGTGALGAAYIHGIDGVNVGSVSKVVTMASDQLGTATITAGTGVSIVPTANVITVNAVGGGVTWTVETVNLVGAVNHGYIANKAGTLTITLPAASAIGDVIKVTGINTALGWQIQCGAGQQIFVGAGSTTVAGSITSTAIRDSIEIVCIATNLTWNAVNWVGNLTLA